MKFATLTKFILATGLIFSPLARSAYKVGNGGDYIRATYIKMGEAIINYLENTEKGQNLLKAKSINIATIAASLDISKIEVNEQLLRDNSGSVVEALGEPDKVILHKESWFNHFEKSRDIYFLVFHEMLRSAGINDDNYIISSEISPFPVSRRIDSKIVPSVPLISQDNLNGVFSLKDVTLGGTGCGGKTQTHVEFDQEKNILDVSTQNFRAEIWDAKKNDRKSCQIAIPITLPKKKRLVISQMDLIGKVDITTTASAQVSFEAFLAGSKAPTKTRIFNQANLPLNGSVLTRRTEVLKSACGKSDIVRLNSNVQTSGESPKKISSLTINRISLFLTLEDCH
jgi:hypothetical protein